MLYVLWPDTLIYYDMRRRDMIMIVLSIRFIWGRFTKRTDNELILYYEKALITIAESSLDFFILNVVNSLVVYRR